MITSALIRTFLTLVVASALPIAAIAKAPTKVPNAPTGEIEKHYYDNGPHEVSHWPEFGCCDSAGYAFDVYAPRDLNQVSKPLPIITFGNGTDAQPYYYDYLLRHLASWGFAIVATRQPNTGIGTEIRDAADFMVKENARPDSPFFGRLNTKRIGAMGHSQGATGVLNAMRDAGGSIRTAIAMALPAQRYCSSEENCTDTKQLTSGSVFFLNGSLDAIISPSYQPQGTKGLQSNSAYYRATPDQLPKFWATLRGTSHNDMLGQPDCGPVGLLCTNGVYGFLGYPTAWMMDQLKGDAQAHTVFVDGSGEIFSQTKNWRHQTSNIAP
ncbi:MAG TPA: hypothetical protein VFY73_14270 [Ideonella sp.]|uniref:hypothetical protein n=1 Tax=Ideonella sp. TaxID=1929293 RepID=UPI002E324F84|nr:hypothetical protein [Ideonella sp.]HEX5685184.1 hypothetical protein [Ideonella sp.]